MKSTKPFMVMPKRNDKRPLVPSLRRLSLTVVAAMALAGDRSKRSSATGWLRNQANFDDLIDFAALMQGPVVQLADGGFAESIRPEWNCDNTHPNPAGYQAMGEFIDLGMFENIGTWGNGH